MDVGLFLFFIYIVLHVFFEIKNWSEELYYLLQNSQNVAIDTEKYLTNVYDFDIRFQITVDL
jgi:hypothetical protein